MTDSPTLALAKDLLSRQSVTPVDAGCQDVMIERLKALGFEIEVMVFALPSYEIALYSLSF